MMKFLVLEGKSRRTRDRDKDSRRGTGTIAETTMVVTGYWKALVLNCLSCRVLIDAMPWSLDGGQGTTNDNPLVMIDRVPIRRAIL